MIDYTKISTPELTVFQSALFAYIQEINEVLRNLNIIKKHSGIIYDAEKRITSLNAKSNEAEKKYESIQVEIEKRMSKKLEMKLFDYSEIRETQEQAKELLDKYAK
jgi:hypothetical protein